MRDKYVRFVLSFFCARNVAFPLPIDVIVGAVVQTWDLLCFFYPQISPPSSWFRTFNLVLRASIGLSTLLVWVIVPAFFKRQQNKPKSPKHVAVVGPDMGRRDNQGTVQRGARGMEARKISFSLDKYHHMDGQVGTSKFSLLQKGGGGLLGGEGNDYSALSVSVTESEEEGKGGREGGQDNEADTVGDSISIGMESRDKERKKADKEPKGKESSLYNMYKFAPWSIVETPADKYHERGDEEKKRRQTPQNKKEKKKKKKKKKKLSREESNTWAPRDSPIKAQQEPAAGNDLQHEEEHLLYDRSGLPVERISERSPTSTVSTAAALPVVYHPDANLKDKPNKYGRMLRQRERSINVARGKIESLLFYSRQESEMEEEQDREDRISREEVDLPISHGLEEEDQQNGAKSADIGRSAQWEDEPEAEESVEESAWISAHEQVNTYVRLDSE